MIHIRWVKKVIFAIILLLIMIADAHAMPMVDTDISEIDLKHEIIRNCPLSVEQQYFIFKECDKAELSYDMVMAIIKLESNFDAYNVSQGRDIGLMQINSEYADWYAELANLEKYSLTNWKDNVKLGISGLRFYRDHYRSGGMPDEIIWYYLNNSYNMGIKGYERHVASGKGLSRAYDRKVMEYKIQFEMEAIR